MIIVTEVVYAPFSALFADVRVNFLHCTFEGTKLG